MKFTKMQGAGNDFIVINNIEEKLPQGAGLRAGQTAVHAAHVDRCGWYDDRGRAAKRRRLPHVFL